MKKILFVFTCTLILSSFSHTDYVDENGMIDVWFKYDEPINGYDVSMHCKQAYASGPNFFSMELHLKNDTVSINKTLTKFIALERIWNDVYTGQDTIILHNTHKELGNPLLDCANIVYFEDMNFDGKDELVLCMFPGGSPNSLDCENFIIFHTDPYLHLCDNAFAREIGDAPCRTMCTVDSINKSITLTGIESSFEHTITTFWFKDGFLYKSDWSHIIGNKKVKHQTKRYKAKPHNAEKELSD